MFEKSELTFAIVMIVIYVVGQGLMQRVSDAIGMKFVAEAAFDVLMSAVLIVFIKRNKLAKHLGLRMPEASALKMLVYLPMLLIAAGQFFFVPVLNMNPVEYATRCLMMCGVGFLEELLFRGFLFRGIAKDNVKQAIIISSITFGVGHIVNLLNGYDITKNIIQIVFAVAVGFMLIFVLVRTRSIIPCIVFHALNNSLSPFKPQALIDMLGSEQTAEIVISAAGVVIAAAYTIYVVKVMPKKELAD